MPRVITVGLNPAIDRVLEVPNLRIGGHVRARQLWRSPAGKAANVSKALACLGTGSVATGFIGQEEAALFERHLRSLRPGRIDCQLLPVAGRTRENVTLVDPVRRTDTHLRDEGFAVRRADLENMRRRIVAVAQPQDLLVFTGSLPRGMDAGHLKKLLQATPKTQARLVLDLDGALLRQLGLGGLGGASSSSPRRRAAGLRPWMIKPNLQELADLLNVRRFRDRHAVLQAARKLAQEVDWVVVSLGADGVLLVHQDQAWHGCIRINQAQVVNTVGCGDSLLAGVLAGYLADPAVPSPHAMLRLGLAAATANALEPGVADFAASAARRLQKRVQIQDAVR